MSDQTPPPADAIAIQVNGERHTVAAEATVADLLATLGRDPRVLAVERNKELVPRRTHAQTTLRPNDCIEIVTLVGGG